MYSGHKEIYGREAKVLMLGISAWRHMFANLSKKLLVLTLKDF